MLDFCFKRTASRRKENLGGKSLFTLSVSKTRTLSYVLSYVLVGVSDFSSIGCRFRHLPTTGRTDANKSPVTGNRG